MKKHLILAAMAAAVSHLAVAADSMYVTAGGDVGIGTNEPMAALHVVRNDDNGETMELLLENSSAVRLGLANNDTGLEWVISNDTRFRITQDGVGMNMDANGNMVVTGTVSAQNISVSSDRNIKTNIQDIDSDTVLEKLKQLPVSTWSYKSSPDQRHIGPMAQDFHAAFGLGGSDKQISVVDAAGVALAAVKALTQRLEEKEARIAELERKLAQQEALVARVKTLEAVAAKLIREKQPSLHSARLEKP